MVDWKRVRADFPAAIASPYFLSSGMTPPPRIVSDSICAAYQGITEVGDAGWEVDVEAYRGMLARFARLMNADADDCTFVANTSTAMSLMAASFRQHAGRAFNVVSTMDEFPASTVPFEYQGVRMRYVEPVEGRYPVERVLAQVDEETIAVVHSFVQYATGFRQDLKALGGELKKRGVCFIVNATQGFPLFPVDMQAMHIDALTCSLLKWGFAGHVGSLFSTTPTFRERFPSPIGGWLSIEPPADDFIHTAKNVPIAARSGAAQYQVGTINLQTVNALQVAFDYLETIGWERIRERLFDLTDALIEGLECRGAQIITPHADRSERSAIVSFRMGDETAALMEELRRRKIHCAWRAGNIRVSVNIFNDESDINRLFDVVEGF